MRQGWVIFAVTLGLLAILLVTLEMPVLGLAILAVGLFALWAFFRPLAAACTLAFLATAIPKAGIKVAGFPFPIFLLGIFISVLIISAISPRRRHGTLPLILLFAYCAWIVLRSVVFTQDGPSQTFAFLAWALLPVVLLAISTSVTSVHPSFPRAFQLGFLVSVAFALVQQVGGVQATAIPGITYAWGDDLTQKFNTITLDTGADLTKIPSTYQNGNVYGITAAVFLVVSLGKIFSRRASRLDYAVALGAVIAIVLSGSRTAIIGVALAALLLILRRGGVGRKLFMVVSAGLVVALILATQPGLLGRYSLDLLLSTGGAGRASQWAGFLSQLSLSEFLFGTSTRLLSEGWVGIVMQIGAFGLLLLVLTVVTLVKGIRAWGAALVVLLVGAAVDSTYVVFPTWFIPAAYLTGSPRQPEKVSSSSADSDASDERPVLSRI